MGHVLALQRLDETEPVENCRHSQVSCPSNQSCQSVISTLEAA